MLEHFERMVIFYSLFLILNEAGRNRYHETGNPSIVYIIFAFVCVFTALWHEIKLADEWFNKRNNRSEK